MENPLHRGKKVEVIDLKSPGGKARALELIAQADALIEGFRPGVMERLGFGPQIARRAIPDWSMAG